MYLKKFDLTNNKALITGAGGLLGFEHSMALMESNCSVIITDISMQNLLKTKEKLIEKFPEKQNKIIAYQMDVTDINSIKDVMQKLNKCDLIIDILINNAAIDHKIVSEKKYQENNNKFEEFSLDKWDNEIKVGLTGAFQCSKVFGHNMLKNNKSGVILNIASDLSVIAPDQRIYKSENPTKPSFVKPVTYSVIKTGLIGLTKYLSTYWADKGIRTNALSPGGVHNGQDKEFVSKISKLIPMGRMAKCEEYRGVIQFLCSDASLYLNGQNIVMDGGRSVW